MLSDSRFRAFVGDTLYGLGRGATNSAAWCAGSAYFISSPRPGHHGAQVVRWDGTGVLTAVYEGGRPGAIWCAGDHLVLRLGDSDGHQYTASLP